MAATTIEEQADQQEMAGAVVQADQFLAASEEVRRE
jgi:hypothetical protein